MVELEPSKSGMAPGIDPSELELQMKTQDVEIKRGRVWGMAPLPSVVGPSSLRLPTSQFYNSRRTSSTRHS